MTEAEWLTSTDPAAMLAWLTGPDHEEGWSRSRQAPGLSDRKLRLMACACVRHVWHRLDDDRSRQAVEAAEGYADDETVNMEAGWFTRTGCCEAVASDGVIKALAYSAEFGLSASTQAALLHDIVGNPFQPWWVEEQPTTKSNGHRRAYNPSGHTALIATLQQMRHQPHVLEHHWLTPRTCSILPVPPTTSGTHRLARSTSRACWSWPTPWKKPAVWTKVYCDTCAARMDHYVLAVARVISLAI